MKRVEAKKNVGFLLSLRQAEEELASKSAKCVTNLMNAFESLCGRQNELAKIFEEFDRQTIAEGFRETFTGPSRLIRLNIGGLLREISTATMCREEFPTLLGCLLKERWDCLLLKDKTGRIFLDFDGDWLDPVLDGMRMTALQSLPLSDAEVRSPTPVNSAGYNAVVEHFRLPLCDPIPLALTQTLIRQLGIASVISSITAGLNELFPGKTVLVDIVRTWSRAKRSSSDNSLFSSLPFPGLALVVIQTTDNNLTGFFTDLDIRTGTSGHVTSPCTKVFVAKSGAQVVEWSSGEQWIGITDRQPFPASSMQTNKRIILCKGQLHGHSFHTHPSSTSDEVNFVPQTIEVYAVTLAGKTNIFPSLSPKLPQSVVNIVPVDGVNRIAPALKDFAVDQCLIDCVAQLNSFDALTHELNRFQAEVSYQEELALQEVLFVEQHVRRSLGLCPQASMADYAGPTLARIAGCVQRLLLQLPAIKAGNCATLPDTESRILYLNAGGRKICVSRQVLAAAAPDCQIYVRVSSGRWNEQLNSMDSDGCVFYVSSPHHCLLL